ncbi:MULTISPECIES: hypothetical protein [Amycolatopsis]|uniref:Uncharacterized protein n=1 Tax=Amycolatopsis tucumanensis TaxID=401106 RepID=A0ABP7HW87_9PSEU|nr:hypothetical protein [Amycolatopsis tucumanensis]MCF6426911.1 hypothetical protein [Amycolatopsis tucumanensis]
MVAEITRAGGRTAADVTDPAGADRRQITVHTVGDVAYRAGVPLGRPGEPDDVAAWFPATSGSSPRCGRPS